MARLSLTSVASVCVHTLGVCWTTAVAFLLTPIYVCCHTYLAESVNSLNQD